VSSKLRRPTPDEVRAAINARWPETTVEYWEEEVSRLKKLDAMVRNYKKIRSEDVGARGLIDNGDGTSTHRRVKEADVGERVFL